MRRFKSRKCPICRDWVSVPRETIDFIHRCRKEDGSRMTADNEYWKIPNRQNIKFDEPAWNHIGLNVRMPKKRKRRSDIIDNIYEDINVDTFITWD